ncbi:hypothetical protein APHAL10511_008585 [Amanita phalloides]|nr:hypothetical protein APHAL10511_008585 [Amanita phalloides]
MVQTAEAEAFLARVAALPKGPAVELDEVLQPSLDDEMVLRRLLATDRSNARLSNPYVGLVDVFSAPTDIRITRARVVKDDQDWNAKYVMPLPEDKRREEGEPCIVADLDDFKRNWGVFTEGSLSQLVDWNNVIAAGGSVLACLTPLSDEDKVSKRAIRKHYHSAAYPTSDVDLFLWGLTPEQAEKKIIQIYEAVRDSVPWDVTCVRTKNAISILSQYPYRSVQIVLRLYHSPAEVLAGFDIDAPCCAYDGARVWANPRAIVAMMRQCNTTDVTRRSPSYEVRLSKYARRGFEVYVPSLVRTDIDPTIFERSIVRVEGLARLLVLERLATFDQRQLFLRSRRELRGRPSGPWRQRRHKRKYKNDLKSIGELEELEMNNYDVASLHIPYGPSWDARRIDKLIYQTDLGMNSTFNPKNKGRRLHRHPAFFGTMEECIEDCCENCPQPIDDAERELQIKEDEVYIRGQVTFMQDNPGRQVITGSFNPIDVGEWSAQVYIGQMERFFAAIATHDRATVANMIKEGVDVNRRDHVGRSPLHFAILCHATEVACDLVDAGARMTARLVDGRTSLHLAVQHDEVVVVRKLLERSAQNKDAVGAGTNEVEDSRESIEKGDRVRLSSEDDWSSEDDGSMDVDDHEGQADDEDGMDEDKENDNQDEESSDEDEDDDNEKQSKKKEDEPAQGGDEIPDDNTEEPDVFNLDAADWDLGLTPLGYAVIFASLPIIEDLMASGANVKESTQNNKLNMHPLTLTLLRPDEDEACKVAEKLILAGATSSPADAKLRTIFYIVVASKKVKLASTIMKCDPNLNAVLDFPSVSWYNVVFPIVLAINERQYAMVAALLTYGAKLDLVEEDITKATASRSQKDTRVQYGNNNLFSRTHMPIEAAIANYDDIAQLLINLGVNVNLGVRNNEANYCAEEDKSSILDWVNKAIEAMEKQIQDEKQKMEDAKGKVETIKVIDFSKVTSWQEYAMLAVKVSRYRLQAPASDVEEEDRLAEIENMKSTKQYFEDVKKLLVSIGAKTWAELRPSDKPKSTPRMQLTKLVDDSQDGKEEKTFEDYDFVALSSRYYGHDIPRHLVKRYHELYRVCFIGDHAKIQMLCLPPNGAPVDELPLQITVQLRDPGGRYITGVTPFSIAVEKRMWDTARLILAIAAAQYEVEESEAEFSVGHMDLDDDGSDGGSDDGSNCSGRSDDTIGWGKDNYYVDVSKRPSAVKCDARPGLFLTMTRPYGYIHHGQYLEETVFAKAIREDDLESFVKLFNMVTNLPIPEDVTGAVTRQVLAYDRHDMLDELIRKTGVGIDLKTVRREAKDAIPVNDENKLYLGLNVHGKKRTDLARRNDPNVGYEAQEHPLLWKALVLGSEKIVDYLGTDKPYDAYRSYAMGHSDERAERLRSIEKLKELLPQWLGFRTNSLGESPLTVAVLSGEVDMLKILFAKHKSMMKSALHDKYKGTNSTILHIAVGSKKVVDTKMLDFLLAKNISPLETDTAGRNIYHILCQRNDCRLLGHLLEKLPREINEEMFKQQARENLKTPLHFAVEAKAIKAVELLLARSNVANTIRDCDGCFPLHIAIRRGCPRITKLLIDSSPSTLFTEDGVGSTALESAALIQFRDRMSSFTDGDGLTRQVTCAESRPSTGLARFNLAHLEKELPLLRETIDSLLKLGKLRKNTKLEKELLGFADRMEEQMCRLQQAPIILKKPEKTKVDENPVENVDHSATYEVVREVLKYAKGERELVHLIDVQKSVDNNMPRGAVRKADVKDDVPAEEKETVMSIVQEHTNLGVSCSPVF